MHVRNHWILVQTLVHTPFRIQDMPYDNRNNLTCTLSTNTLINQTELDRKQKQNKTKPITIKILSLLWDLLLCSRFTHKENRKTKPNKTKTKQKLYLGAKYWGKSTLKFLIGCLLFRCFSVLEISGLVLGLETFCQVLGLGLESRTSRPRFRSRAQTIRVSKAWMRPPETRQRLNKDKCCTCISLAICSTTTISGTRPRRPCREHQV